MIDYKKIWFCAGKNYSKSIDLMGIIKVCRVIYVCYPVHLFGVARIFRYATPKKKNIYRKFENVINIIDVYYSSRITIRFYSCRVVTYKYEVKISLIIQPLFHLVSLNRFI